MIDTLIEIAKIIKDWGPWGIAVAQIGVIIWLFRVIVCNHLDHLNKTVDANTVAITELTKEVIKDREKLCKLDGKVEILEKRSKI